MSPLRTRSLSRAGLLTALSLGVVSLAGCAPFNPAPPVPGSNAVLPSGGGMAAATGTGTATTGGATAKPPVKLTPAIKGKAAIAGKPMGGAAIKVIDASTGKPVSGLVAAGKSGAAAKFGLLQEAGGFDLPEGTKCETDGSFAIQFPAGDDTFKVVISDDAGNSISNLVDVNLGENGEASLNALGGGGQSGDDFTMEISSSTTLAGNSIETMLKMGDGLSDQASGGLLGNLFEKGDALVNQIQSTMTPEREQQIADAAGKAPDGGLDNAFMQDVIGDFGLNVFYKDMATDFMTEFAELNSNPENRANTTDSKLNAEDFGLLEEIGGFNVNLSGDAFTFEGNGLNFSFDQPEFAAEVPGGPGPDGPGPDGPGPDGPEVPGEGPELPAPPDEPPVDIPTDGGASDENNALPLAAGVFRNSDTEGTFFSPDMSITASGSSLSLTVNQDAGEDDVRDIVARFPKAKVTIAAPGGSWDANEVLASGTTDRDGTMSTAMIKYSAFTADAISAAMDGETYSASSSQAVFTGYWMNNTTQLAKVVVYDNGTDVILSITYTHDSINDAATIENGGHETSLTTVNNVIQLTGSARADSLLTSRTNFTAERFDDLAP